MTNFLIFMLSFLPFPLLDPKSSQSLYQWVKYGRETLITSPWNPSINKVTSPGLMNNHTHFIWGRPAFR